METETARKAIGSLVVIGILLAVGLIALAASIETVDTGRIGVVTRWGRVTGRTLDSGGHTVMPFADSVLTYNTQKIIYETRRDPDVKVADDVYLDHAVDTNTSDGQQVNVYFTVRFSVDPTKVKETAVKVGSQDAVIDKIVRTEARIWARNIPREYEAAELYSGNVTEVQDRITEALRPTFEANGLIMDSVGVREIEFTKQYIQAIEDKQIEAVKVETAKNKAEQAKFQKEQAITEAEGQAEQQRLQRETISDQLLQKMLIERWDGHYPQYLITGGADQFILPLPNQ